MILPTPLITFLASYLIWLMFLVWVYLWRKGKKHVVKRGLLAVGIAWMIATVLQIFVVSPRPFSATSEAPLVVSRSGYLNSFPSGHAAAASALAFSLFPEEPRLGIIMLFGSFLVDAGRVLALVHYWPDVFGGAILAFLIVRAVHNLLA